MTHAGRLLSAVDTGRLLADSDAMVDSTDEFEVLRELERTRLEALVRADMAVAEVLHADDYQLITPGGAALSKREYLGGVASGALPYRVFEPASDVSVKISADMAVVRYRARIDMDLASGRDAGIFWHTDMYQRREGQWQAVWSQATRTSGEAAC